MVGAQWSLEEERCFWQRIIPISPSRAGIDVAVRDENKWKELVPLMERWMGEEARRKYTAQMLCGFVRICIPRVQSLLY